MYSHTLIFPRSNSFFEMKRLTKDFNIGRIIIKMTEDYTQYKILSHQPLQDNDAYRERLAVLNAEFIDETVDEMTADEFEQLFEAGVLKEN